jgi:hypothetical protein
MAQHPDGGMYGIKLIHPQHFEYVFLTPRISTNRVPRLMNFSNKPHTRAIAANIPRGHRAIVYVTKPIQKFVWAIEYTGGVLEESAVASSVSIPSDVPDEWRHVFLPIRFLATIIDVADAPDAQDILRRAGVDFTPDAFPMKYISAAEYQRLFEAIDWQLVAPSAKGQSS